MASKYNAKHCDCCRRHTRTVKGLELRISLLREALDGEIERNRKFRNGMYLHFEEEHPHQ